MSEEILEFGIKRKNEERRDGGFAIVFDPGSQKYAVGLQYENNSFRLFSGGLDDGEDVEEGIKREVVEESGLYNFEYTENMGAAMTHYYNTLRKVNRVAKATCLLIILRDASVKDIALEEHEKFELAWADAEAILADMESRNGNKDNDHWIYFFKKSVNRAIELGYDKTTGTI